VHEENNEEGFRVSCSIFKTPTIYSFSNFVAKEPNKVHATKSIELFPNF
jgi:hypothetical protein